MAFILKCSLKTAATRFLAIHCKCRNPKAHLGVGSLDDGRRADLRGSEPGKGIAVLRPAQFSGFG